MANEIVGKLHKKQDAEAVGTGSFVKREFVVVTDEQYPQHIQLELHQDRVDLLDPYEIGETLKVSINLRGREWINPQGEKRYFNTLVAWRIERLAVASPPTFEPQPQQAQSHIEDDDEPDDLPF